MQDNGSVSAQLDTLVKLVSILVTRDMTQKEQISVLSMAGLQPKAIGDLIGKPTHTVSVTLSDLRKQATSKQKGKKS